MAELLDDNFMVCSECLQAIANNDFTGLDYHYSAAESAQRLQAIHEGLDTIGEAGEHITVGDWTKDEEFSTSACDCCSSQLAGSRHHCIILGNNRYGD